MVMERGMLWFKCAAMRDPVRPVVKNPPVLGWEAKERKIDLTIERPLSGEEVLHRMQGWFTVDVYEVINIIKEFGKFKLLDDHNLVIETLDNKSLDELSKRLEETFGEEVWVEHIPKDRLE
jgi:hypothetical protein